MSVLTRHTLLCLCCCGIIVIRYSVTRPATIHTTTAFVATLRVNDLPYIKNKKQYLPTNSPYVIIVPRFPLFHYGDVLQVKGELSPNLIINNPKIIIRDHRPNPLIDVLYTLRNRFEEALHQNLPRDHAALAEGMLLGTKEEFSEGVTTAFQNTGTLHMIVVSGYNITLVISSIMALAGYLHRRVVILFALAGCLLFILLSGAQPPAIRAGAMAYIVLLGQVFGRPADTLRVLIISILLILLLWPPLLISLSFQLSCAATLGILLLPWPINKCLARIPLPKVKIINTKWLQCLKSEFVTTVSAQIAVAPLIANTFGTLSLIAPLANLLVAWSVPYIMISTLILCLANFIHPMIAKLISFELYGITAYFLQSIKLLGGVPFAAINNFKINVELMIGIYLVIVFFIVKSSDQLMYSKDDENKKEKNE